MYPIVPGHEFIGKVTMIGSAVKDITIGQRVGVSPIVRSCNKCDLCTSHFGQLCAGKVNTYNAKYMDGVTRGVSMKKKKTGEYTVFSYFFCIGLCR